jgi:hypothetical protein
MALQTSGPISLNNVNQELGNAAPYTQVISLNDTAVRTLFAIASGAIRMSDGYGKSSIPPYQFINQTGEGGDQDVCGGDNTWSITLQIAGTLPITWELLMYANGCTGEHVLQTGSSGGAGYNPNYAFTVDNAAASGNGTYTGGSIKYKAAHYKVKVFDSAGSPVLTTPAYHVYYGTCTDECNFPGTPGYQTGCSGNQPCLPPGEQCQTFEICSTETVKCHDCSGDCVYGDGCGDCSEEEMQNWLDNPNRNPGCPPTGCGTYQTCECPSGYDTVFTLQYSPNGICN